MNEEIKFPVQDSLHLPGFTPVRRPPPYIFNDTPISNAPVAWTTTRCNRLIRPITSRIALLRKQRQTVTFHPIQEAALATTELSQQTEQNISKPASHSLLPSCHEDDLDWTPDERPRKKLRRTYSTKSNGTAANSQPPPVRRQSSHPIESIIVPISTLPGQAAVQEEDGNNMVGDGEAEVEVVKKRQYKSRKSDTRHTFRQLAKAVNPGDWMLYDGLYSSLDHLLKSTAKSKPPLPTGAKSLFSTCLRRVPQLIAEEQEAENEKGPDTSEDVANAMYEDIEAYGCTSEFGWKPLREIARAHGVMVVGDAITDGLITPSISRGLVILCLQASAFDEAQSLTCSLLSRMKPLGIPKNSVADLFGAETSVALQTLRDVAAQSGRWDFLFRSLTNLLARGIIPIQWMSSEDMLQCWNQVFMLSVEEGGVTADAAALLRKVIALAYRDRSVSLENLIQRLRRGSAHQSRSKNRAIVLLDGSKYRRGRGQSQSNALSTRNADQLSSPIVSNLISILLSVNSFRDNDSPPPEYWMDLLHTILVDLSCQQELQRYCTDGTLNYTDLDVPSVIILGRLLVPSIAHNSQNTSCLPETTPTLLSEHSENLKIKEVLSGFLRSLALCWSRLNSSPSQDLLDRLVHHCMNLANSASSETPRRFLLKLATITAFDFAESNSNASHLDWALEIEEAVESAMGNVNRAERASRCDLTSTSASSTTYRWEEGICEWIASTPAVVKSRPNTDKMATPPRKSTSPLVRLPQLIRPVVPIHCTKPISAQNRENLARDCISPSQIRYCLDRRSAMDKHGIDTANKLTDLRQTEQIPGLRSHLKRKTSGTVKCYEDSCDSDSSYTDEKHNEDEATIACSMRSHNIRPAKRLKRPSEKAASFVRATHIACSSSEDELGF